jgi:hypothetical protein
MTRFALCTPVFRAKIIPLCVVTTLRIGVMRMGKIALPTMVLIHTVIKSCTRVKCRIPKRLPHFRMQSCGTGPPFSSWDLAIVRGIRFGTGFIMDCWDSFTHPLLIITVTVGALDFQVRCLACKSAKGAQIACFIGGLFVFFVGIPFSYLGSITRYEMLLSSSLS